MFIFGLIIMGLGIIVNLCANHFEEVMFGAAMMISGAILAAAGYIN